MVQGLFIGGAEVSLVFGGRREVAGLWWKPLGYVQGVPPTSELSTLPPSCAAASSFSPESGLSSPVVRWDLIADDREALPTDGIAGYGGKGGLYGEGSGGAEGTALVAGQHDMPTAEILQACSLCQTPLDQNTIWGETEFACESCKTAWEWSGAEVAAPGARELPLSAFGENVSAHLPPGAGLTITAGS